ncbi:hypothetical protein [Parachitinimonas caeni]|uniref:PilJ/NarX-like methyl-accepting chemotaxis transducer n=1 Tax=Parachitinimonas caeni TaxID=3031301 RepID=A0ABT7DZR9_9NEIS|nr:hypothetical protein [Parachitinimonas caeni]MDK2125552.1 hypothetical protein [Parachitinimonas caeni]
MRISRLLVGLIVSLLPLLAVAAPAKQDAAKTDPAKLAAVAASERLLAERMGKAYALLALGLTDTDPKRQLEESRERFDSQLKMLQQLNSGGEVKDNYGLLGQLWGDYKTLVSAPPSKEGGGKLAELNEEVVWIAQKGSQLMLQQPGVSTGQASRAAQDLATLSQRLARVYLLKSWGLGQAFLAKDLTAAKDECRALLMRLRNSPHNTPSITAQIDLLATQWTFFEQAINELARANNDRNLIRNVATTSERMYEVASALATQYGDR